MSTRFDNLIPLHARLNEWQLAGLKPTKVAEKGLGCRLYADTMIAMPDGTRLAADVYTPRRPGRYPVIVQFSAYNFDLFTAGAPMGANEIGSPPIIADRGYVQVIVTARGVGRSEGQLMPWLCYDEALDHLHCVEWAAEQPFSNGYVCLFGTSYYGMNQASVAIHRPPMLKAFFCNEICTDYRRHIFRFGGNPNADFLSLWAGANFTSRNMKRHVPPLVRAMVSHIINRPWLWKLFHRRVDKFIEHFRNEAVDPRALEFFTALLTDSDQGLPTPFWNGPSAKLGEIDIPFVVVQNRGMIALHQFGAYDLFENAGTQASSKRLIVGPAEFLLPVYSWQLEALAFFDHVLKDCDNGYGEQPPVRYWDDTSQSWGVSDGMPPTDAKPIRLYGLPTGLLDTRPPDGGSLEWISVPRGIQILPGVSPQEISFTWSITEPTVLVGPATVGLSFSCNEIDSYLVARLDRRSPDGRCHYLAMGYLRPSRRRVDLERSTSNEIAIDSDSIQALVPNEAVDLRFSLTPVAATLNPGDQLVLRLASRTDLFSPTVGEGFVALGSASPPYFARNTVHCGEGTYLEVSQKA